MNQYPSFIYTKTQPYIFQIIGYVFLQDTGIEKPKYVMFVFDVFMSFSLIETINFVINRIILWSIAYT